MESKKVKNIITKAKSYMQLQYLKFLFLDARNYVPPDTNLERFAKMWGVGDIEKEIFPYEWFDSWDKLKETSLPPIDAFMNRLRNEECEPKDYQNAVDVWNNKGFKFRRIYDVLLCTRHR